MRLTLFYSVDVPTADETTGRVNSVNVLEERTAWKER